MRKSNDYVWIRSDGMVFGLKTKKNCLICKHCTDIFWDYTHGPYMVYCEKAYNDGSNLPEETKLGTECNLFEIEDGTMTVSEYEEKEKKRQAKEIENFYNFIKSKEWKEWPLSTDFEK